MKYRYSDYSVEQLREELAQLKEKALEAERLGELNQLAIHERKMQIVRSYMLNPDDFKSGETYELQGDPGHTFKIKYVNGIMAWGQRINLLGEKYEKVEALPIALLTKKVNIPDEKE